MPTKKDDTPEFDPTKNPNDQPSLVGGVRVPFEPTTRLRWVKRRGSSSERYVLQQEWERNITNKTLALKRAHGDSKPTVPSVWVDVPRGEE